MAFEIVIPAHAGRYANIEAGTASVSKAGTLTLCRADLTRAGLRDDVVILADVATRRLALRAPRDGEERIARRLRWTKTGGTAVVALGAVLRAMGIDPPAITGRHELTHHDDLLIVQLPGVAAKTAAPRKRRTA